MWLYLRLKYLHSQTFTSLGIFVHLYVHYTGPPATSTNVIAVNICLTDFTASWDPVTSDPVCGPVSYDVTISSSNGVMMMRITDTSYNFTGLIPDSSYTVTVAGINNAGVGRSSSTTIRTFQDSKLTFLYIQLLLNYCCCLNFV